MVTTLPFEKEKAIETILYISKRIKTSDVYHILKVLLFADKKHLEKYGRFICGGHYSAMDLGPVQSECYDLTKEKQHEFQVINNKRLIPARDADIDYLSESDIECLKESIKENGSKTLGQLKIKSHDEAFEKYYREGTSTDIPIEEIAKGLKNSEDIIEYLKYNFG